MRSPTFYAPREAAPRYRVSEVPVQQFLKAIDFTRRMEFPPRVYQGPSWENIHNPRGDRSPNPPWGASAYGSAVARAFDFTDKQYEEAKRAAVQAGVPVVLMFGSSRSQASKNMIERSMPALRQGLAGRAVFLYVDLDSVDKSSKIGQFVDQYVRPRHGGGTGVPYTMVFSQQQRQDGGGKPDRARQTLIGEFDPQSLLRHVLRVFPEVERQQRSYGPPRIVDRPFAPPGDELPMIKEVPLPKDLPNDGSERWLVSKHQQFGELLQRGIMSRNFAEADAYFKAAVDFAKTVKPEDVRLQYARLKNEVQQAMANGSDLEAVSRLSQQALMLKDLALGTGYALSYRGLHFVRARRAPEGAPFLLEAGRHVPELFMDGNVFSGLTQAGYPPEAIWQMMRMCRSCPPPSRDQYLKKPSEAERRPAEKAESEPTRFTEDTYKDAVQLSVRTGKPLVFRFSSKSCIHCPPMKKIYDKADDLLKDAVVVDVDADKAPNLYAGLKAAGLPSLVVAAVSDKISPGSYVPVPVERDKEVDQLSGTATEEQVRRYLERTLAVARQTMEKNGFRKARPAA